MYMKDLIKEKINEIVNTEEGDKIINYLAYSPSARDEAKQYIETLKGYDINKIPIIELISKMPRLIAIDLFSLMLNYKVVEIEKEDV